MKPTTLLLVSALVGLAISTGYPADRAKGNGAEVALQAAIKTEAVDGNLKAAIEQYRKIAETGNRAVAAKALVRMGKCYERLGDVEARKAYERVLRDYADQNEAASQARSRLAALNGGDAGKASEMVARRVWAGTDVDDEGRISPDGHYLSFVDWDTGELAVRDLSTGEKRQVTRTATFYKGGEQYAGASVPSPDSKKIAYAWQSEDDLNELRLIGMNGTDSRTLYRNPAVIYCEPDAWSPDGTQIFGLFETKDDKIQIVMIAVRDGSARVLKTLSSWNGPGPHLSLSPDGRYIIYDFPQKEDFGPRDISILASDGSGEIPLVQHPAHDYVLTWTPDGKSLIFASDRTGSLSAWILELEGGKPHGLPKLWKPDIGRATPLGFTQKGSFYYAVDTSIHDLYSASFDFATGKFLKPPSLVSQLFTGSNKAPDWSPDGKYLAYLSIRHQLRAVTPPPNPTDTIVIRFLETGEERELVPDLKLMLSVFGLRWAADSQSLLVYGRDNKVGFGLFRIDAQTGNVSTLIQPRYDGTDRPWYGRVAPSPDGKTLVLVKNGKGFGAVFLRDMETGQERELAHVAGAGIHDIGLSPSGSQVAYTTQQEPATALWVVPLAGGEPRELLRLKPSEGFPWNLAWTRDGNSIIYGKGQNNWSQSKVELWRISAYGGKPEKLELSMDAVQNFRIHPDGTLCAFDAGGHSNEVWVMENFLPVVRAAK